MMKKSLKVILYMSLLITLLSSPRTVNAWFPVEDGSLRNAVTETCPPVQNTPSFTIAYGSVTLNGSAAPVGSLVKAYSPRNDLVGCFAVTSSGNYGAMYIYGEDTSVVPTIPGMRNNEAVSFTIEGVPATSTPTLLWANDKDLHAVNLVSMGVSANFTATPISGVAPLVVQFTDASSGSITSRLWDFGDGQTSSDINPQHTFNTPGFYTVSLTVNGAAGSDTETKVSYISVYTTVNANFSADKTSGIAPLSVAFTNSSTGSYTNLSWNFGDGGTSSATNPTHSYTTGGVYSVSLTASGPGGTDTETKTNYITGYNPVVAGFTSNLTSGVAPLSVNFTNTSTGSYTSLSWNFGDGETSTATNPSHVFATSGTFTVSLTASGPGGTNQVTASIEVYTPVVANFNASPITGIAPLNVTFTNTSTGNFSSSLWNFGDGSTSTDINPIHNYATKGVYTVTLTVSGLGGTDDEIKTGYITVYSPTQAQFTGSPTSGVAPLSVSFTNQSGGDFTSQTWNFGDGGSSLLANPSHEYLTSGTYTVSLSVDGPGGIGVETKTNYITVYTPVIAGFTATPTSGIGPLQVTFTNQSSGSYDGFSWNFGDGNTSNEVNPTHTYTNKGVYTVTLTASGPGGMDVETRTSYITVYQAVGADFTAGETSGVSPFEVSFSNLSTGDYSNLSWNFGDGGTSTDTNPTHTYNAGGTFTVTLTASGDGGSDQEIKIGYITIYSPVTAEFTYTPENGIAPLSVTFTNTSSGDYDTLSWNFGDGSLISNDINPTHDFLDGGVYPVTLTISGSGGEGIQTHNVTVYDPVQAAFGANVTSGIAPLEVTFSNESLGDYENITWDFGDSTGSYIANPTHIYTTPGIYSVALTVSGLGGSDIETKTGYIVVYTPAVAGFQADSLAGIAPHAVQFTDLSTGDFDTHSWNFGDGGTSSDENPQHTYSTAGVYTVSLVVSGNGGSDTETKTNYITIYEPVVAQFSANELSGIAPLTVVFTNLSTGEFTSQEWQFGDGQTSTTENPSHEYTTPGIYSVTLTVIGAGGTDAETKTDYITVYTPVQANFTFTPSSGTEPLEVSFTNTSTGDYSTYAWVFGDGGTSTDASPQHQYVSPGVYTVSLTVSGNGGSDIETKTDCITVFEPVVAGFTSNVNSGIAPLAVTFTDTSTGNPTSWAWNFGDGSSSTEQSPSHAFTVGGVYIVTLTATGPGGSDTYQNEITVYEPVHAQFSATPISGYSPLTVDFTNESTGDFTSLSWDFGDGSPSSDEEDPSHDYIELGVYTITLTAEGPGGTDTYQIDVRVIPHSVYLPIMIR